MVEPASSETDLPSFERPPVVEVVLGLMFQPLPLGAVGLARLQEKWLADYPRLEEHPAIPPAAPPGFFIDMGGAPQLRLWFINDSNGRIIQIQKDRMILNWRWSEQSGDYPRYEALREELSLRLQELQEFVAENALGSIFPVASEVTYINAIGTEEYTNFHDALNFVTAPPPRLQAPIEANVHLRFDTREAVGRDSNFIVSVNRDLSRDPAPLVLQISSHTQIEHLDELLDALDRGRELVVTTFRDMTTAAMHQKWGKQ